jgi:hypothetical protein
MIGAAIVEAVKQDFKLLLIAFIAPLLVVWGGLIGLLFYWWLA